MCYWKRTQVFLKSYQFKQIVCTYRNTCFETQKCFYNVPGRPVNSICSTSTEKTSEFPDFHLKPLIQSSWSYILDSSDFIVKMKRIGEIPEDAILVTVEVIGLYPSIQHKEGFDALKEKLEEKSS